MYVFQLYVYTHIYTQVEYFYVKAEMDKLGVRVPFSKATMEHLAGEHNWLADS